MTGTSDIRRIATLAAVFVLGNIVAAPCRAADAAELLLARVRSDKIYPRIECLSFVTEVARLGLSIVAVRERHEGDCGGDPDVMPIVDRFRLTNDAKKIEWYDATEDEYVPYAELLAQKRAHP